MNVICKLAIFQITDAKRFIGTNEWLGTDEIDQAMALISHQWPDVTTQTALYIDRPQHFNQAVKFGHGDYAQVLHMDAEQHWIAVTNIAGGGRVRLFDSLGLKVSHKIKRAISSKFSLIQI